MKETAEELVAKRERSQRDRNAPRCRTCHRQLALAVVQEAGEECYSCQDAKVEAVRKSRTLEDIVRENYESWYIDIMTPGQLLAAISNALEELK